MSYESALTKIAIDHRDEIEAALVAAKAECEVAQATLEKLARRIYLLEGILKPVENVPTDIEIPQPGEKTEQMTLHAAMRKVLRESPTRKLRAAEIIAEIDRQNLYRMRDGRVPESQQIHARANHYPELFGKDGSLFFAK